MQYKHWLRLQLQSTPDRNVLQRPVLYCTVLCTALHWTTSPDHAVWCGVMRCDADLGYSLPCINQLHPSGALSSEIWYLICFQSYIFSLLFKALNCNVLSCLVSNGLTSDSSALQWVELHCFSWVTVYCMDSHWDLSDWWLEVRITPAITLTCNGDVGVMSPLSYCAYCSTEDLERAVRITGLNTHCAEIRTERKCTRYLLLVNILILILNNYYKLRGNNSAHSVWNGDKWRHTCK